MDKQAQIDRAIADAQKQQERHGGDPRKQAEIQKKIDAMEASR
jgi:hypothetical protein